MRTDATGTDGTRPRDIAQAPGLTGGPLEEVGTTTYYGQPRPEIVDRIPAGVKRLLDVGCANGAFGGTVKQRFGAQVWGIEIKDEVARIAAQRLDRVINRDALAALDELPEAYFDCVTFNDVLEHLVDPSAILQGIKKHLAQGAVIIASLPNVRHYQVLIDLLVHGNWDYADLGVLDRTHLRFFTHKSIRKLFADNDYELTRLEGINGLTSKHGRALSRLLPPPLQDIQYLQFICIARPR